MSYEERLSKVANTKPVSSSLQIDIYEAKTLSYCILAVNTLIKEDMNKFLDSDFEFRVNLFKQLTHILDLSYQIYQGFAV